MIQKVVEIPTVQEVVEEQEVPEVQVVNKIIEVPQVPRLSGAKSSVAYEDRRKEVEAFSGGTLRYFFCGWGGGGENQQNGLAVRYGVSLSARSM